MTMTESEYFDTRTELDACYPCPVCQRGDVWQEAVNRTEYVYRGEAVKDGQEVIYYLLAEVATLLETHKQEEKQMEPRIVKKTNQLRDLINDTQNVPPELEARLMEYVRGLLKQGLTHREICERCDVTRDAIYRAQRNQPIRTLTHWDSYGSRGMKKPHAQPRRK